MDDDSRMGNELRKSKDNFTSEQYSKEPIHQAYGQEEVNQQFTGFNLFKELLTNAQIKEVFDSINSSGSGLISRQQITFYLDFLGMEASQEDILEMIELCDPPTKGLVDFESFETMIKTVNPLAHNMFPTPDLKMKKQVMDDCHKGQLLNILTSDKKEVRNQIMNTLTEEQHFQVESYPHYQQKKAQKKLKSTYLMPINNLIQQPPSRTQSQLKSIQLACQQFYEEYFDLQLLNELITLSLQYHQKQKPMDQLIIDIRKRAPIKQTSLQQLLSKLVYVNGNVEVAQFYTYLVAVTGVSSHNKMTLVLPMYPEILDFATLNHIINRLMFSSSSKMQTRLKTVFGRKNISNKITREQAIELFHEFSYNLII